MNWDALGAIVEIIGAIAVLVTLFYLATQIRQSNATARFETTRELMAQFNDLNRLYATDSTVRQVLLKEGDLSREEQEQLYTYADMYCNAWATAQLAFNQGLLDAALYQSVVKDVHVALNRWPSMQQEFERWFRNYPEMADSEVFKAINQS
jgi:hypothetical protein